jgi:hypothetical protein
VVSVVQDIVRLRSSRYNRPGTLRGIVIWVRRVESFFIVCLCAAGWRKGLLGRVCAGWGWEVGGRVCWVRRMTAVVIERAASGEGTAARGWGVVV